MENYKLGKRAPAPITKKTLMLKDAFASELPPIPMTYEFKSNCKLQFGLFGNDAWGDCVKVGQANQTIAFEDDEQMCQVPVTTNDVLKGYWKEQGWKGVCKPKPGGRYDNGLVVSESLKRWQKVGWKVGNKTYKIYAYAYVPKAKHDLVKAGNFLLNGLQLGISLPLSAQDQIGKVWDVTTGAGSEPGSWGGHCVWFIDYPNGMPNVVTWGKPQEMTWAFFDKYVDECWAVVDNKDSKSSSLDLTTLDKYFHDVTLT